MVADGAVVDATQPVRLRPLTRDIEIDYTALNLAEPRKQTGQNEFMKDTGKIRVLCVDDHPVVRDGIAAIINLQPDMMFAGAAATGGEALERFFELRPDVALSICSCQT
jgi:hypothetical protein